jgi:hypothetical protein
MDSLNNDIQRGRPITAFNKTPRSGVVMLHEITVRVWARVLVLVRVRAPLHYATRLVQGAVEAEMRMVQDPAGLSG